MKGSRAPVSPWIAGSVSVEIPEAFIDDFLGDVLEKRGES